MEMVLSIWTSTCVGSSIHVFVLGSDCVAALYGQMHPLTKISSCLLLHRFFEHAHIFLRENPARIILIVGGPGSGKGSLSKRLERECNVGTLHTGTSGGIVYYCMQIILSFSLRKLAHL
jgi:hypothetical protein